MTPVNVGLDHIHAHTAPRKIGHFFRGGKSRQKYKIEKFALAHARGLLRGDHAALDGLALNAGRIDPGSVVRDFDQHLPALVARPQFEAPLRTLAASDALLRQFDSVIHRIPDDVSQRVLDRLEQASVEFRFLAFHLDQHLLAARRGYIANHARELVKDVADRLHARSHHFFLQFARQQIELLRWAGQVGSDWCAENCVI